MALLCLDGSNYKHGAGCQWPRNDCQRLGQATSGTCPLNISGRSRCKTPSRTGSGLGAQQNFVSDMFLGSFLFKSTPHLSVISQEAILEATASLAACADWFKLRVAA